MKLRILHLEDDAADAALIQRALVDDGFEPDMHRVFNREGFESALSEGGFDLILSDYSMPGFDGVSALGIARARKIEAPFIMMSGTIGEDRAVEALKTGATDFVLKDRPKRLGMAIRRALAGVQERQQRRVLEAQLLQSQKLEAVGRLTGSIAHDFNNLLSIVLTTTELLLTDMHGDDPRRADITAIQEAADRGEALVKQLLAFSRKQVLKPRVLDLNDLLKRLEPLLLRLVGRSVKLELKLDPKLSSVKADAGQLEQVVVNLCVNARDAMNNDGRITIETANVTLDGAPGGGQAPGGGGPHVRLAVTDTGTGMDEETMSRIFEPYFTTKPEGVGTGLGLPTVYGIIQQSGGHIWVTSQPGKGSTFEVYLPPQDGQG